MAVFVDTGAAERQLCAGPAPLVKCSAADDVPLSSLLPGGPSRAHPRADLPCGAQLLTVSAQCPEPACGIRTRDSRITRVPRKCSWRSTSTDGTPHSSQATEGPGRTRFVSHSLSHGALILLRGVRRG
jgi:hypothetical protein